MPTLPRLAQAAFFQGDPRLENPNSDSEGACLFSLFVPAPFPQVSFSCVAAFPFFDRRRVFLTGLFEVFL